VEVAQDSVKTILKNEKGNISATITLIILITGTIGYFMLVTDQVDSEIRTLSSTQATSYLKSDVLESIRRLLRDGGNTGCDNTNAKVQVNGKSLQETFQNLQLLDSQSQFDLTIQRSGGQSYKDFFSANKDIFNCFFHPTRYGANVEFEFFKISIKRYASPNMINLSNYLVADVTIMPIYFGKRHVEKYQLRYRVDAYSMSHFGLIFNSSGSDDVYSIDTGSYAQINAPVLVDQTNRTDSFMLSRLSDFKNIIYNETVYLAAPTVAQDPTSIDFLQKGNLRDFFKDGVLFDVFRLGNAQAVPWKQSTGQYKDLFNYDVTASGRFPLPKLSSNESVHYTSSAGITHLYSNDKENNPIPGGIESHNKGTEEIYSLLLGDKKYVYKSCASADVSSGVYNMIVFNNLSEDFTVDFRSNTSISTPPVFCGLIAARNLTVLLNDVPVDTTDADLSKLIQNHIIGKILLSGKLIIKNKGQLVFTDILELDQDTITPYEVIDDFTNVQVQYFNQKYYSSQNFTLPFFNTPAIYAETDYIAGANRFWVPRDTKEFFTKDCAGKKCRTSPIGSPDPAELILTMHGKDLLYEVFNVE
jgi:hypothetical protein